MKGLRIGRRRGRGNELPGSPLELALRPALVDGRWQIPDRFNFTRDVVEPLARDPKRRALTFLSSEGIIEHRSFMEISEGATIWAAALRERKVGSGDRVIILSGSTVDWLEAVLGIWKMGGVVVPCAPMATPSQLERLVSSTDAVLVVAERSLEQTVERMGFSTEVHLFDEGTKRSSKDVPADVPSHDSASRDLAFIVSTSGVAGSRKDVAHTHGSIFATRVQAEHWLDVGRGDAVWCTSESTSPLTMWNSVIGPWSRGAEVVLQQGAFDADERLDLLFRLGPSILCQSPAEYRALAEHPKLERFRSPRLRRLVSTGDFLDPEVVAVFEERWGMSIADGYGQAETNIVVANLADGAVKPGSCGRALPGHHVAVIDDQGNELPHGIEGDLAVRGRPPTLFAGYWELPEETKSAFLGDWYLTGDVAQVDEEGYFTFVGRAEDVISSSGRTFGPYDVERVLDGHPAIARTAVVGMRDLQRGGHFVRAYVVPKRADAGSAEGEVELREYAAQTLPTQQVPREIVFVEELPIVGWKISRHELRERPLGGRPLWETPTVEPDDVPTPAPPALDGEFSPRVEAPAEPVPPVAFVQEPDAVVIEPFVEQFVEPVVPEPVIEHVVEPEPVVAPEPVVEPEPVVAEALPMVEAEPEPELDVQTEPEPMVEAPPEPVVEAQPEPESVEVSEPIAAEAAVPEPEPEHEPEPTVEPEHDDPSPDLPTLVALPEPEETAPEPEPSEEPSFSVVDMPAALPDYVVDAPDETQPVVVPEPEPEPDLSGPLPEFVVEPSADAAPPPAPAAEAEPEEEEDLGPLPDYVIDPSNPRPVAPAPPPPTPEPRPVVEARRPDDQVDETPSQAAGIYFPPVTAFPTLPADRDEDEPRESRRTARPRPAAESGKSKTEPAEPGDEVGEVGWMAGLSNRLSAYSLSEDDAAPAADPDDDDETS
ncbi:MAG TPA: AMP-binding protein [Gaiellaceae bacterium]|nr:AMP-binding protein [Gaiellaceae bacterium]